MREREREIERATYGKEKKKQGRVTLYGHKRTNLLLLIPDPERHSLDPQHVTPIDHPVHSIGLPVKV